MRCRYYPKWESKCIPNENQEIFMSSKRESKYDPSTPSHLYIIGKFQHQPHQLSEFLRAFAIGHAWVGLDI
jgi:hypothetical protein